MQSKGKTAYSSCRSKHPILLKQERRKDHFNEPGPVITALQLSQGAMGLNCLLLLGTWDSVSVERSYPPSPIKNTTIEAGKMAQ